MKAVAIRDQGLEWDYNGLDCPLFEAASEGVLVDPSSNDFNALDLALLIAPVVLPLLGALTFEADVALVHNFLEWLAQANWVAVDGGLSRNAALLPVMTGIVLPCVSFALGTLTATTISTLRHRQVELRSLLNTEACLIRNVLSATESMFFEEHSPDERHRAARLLRQYCTRVLLESRSGINLERLSRQGAANSELDGLTRLLHHAPALPRDTARVEPRFYTTTEFLAQMYLEKLQLSRSERLAILQTTFPAVHWLALTLLGFSVMFSFLFAADQQTLLFLAPVQLRVLFSVLVGALSATACICADLNDPFRGAFRITPSSEQLFLIRDVIDRSLCNPSGGRYGSVGGEELEEGAAGDGSSRRPRRREASWLKEYYDEAPPPPSTWTARRHSTSLMDPLFPM